jgi:hypothetical protein
MELGVCTMNESNYKKVYTKTSNEDFIILKVMHTCKDLKQSLFQPSNLSSSGKN